MTIRVVEPKPRIVAMLRRLAELSVAIEAGFQSDPGTSDLDDEQPICVWMTLKEYRAACQLNHQTKYLRDDGK